MKVAIFGAGLVGTRTAKMLVRAGIETTLISQNRAVVSIAGATTGVGWPHPEAASADVVVLATDALHQFAHARELLRAGVHVIATTDNPREIGRMWRLDDLARSNKATLVTGAAYSPGISTVLAAWLAQSLDQVSSISTARFGTGGPACAREHHRAMSGSATEVHHGSLRKIRAGSGRELVWFPEPVGAADCYRGGLAEPFLLHKSFPEVDRIESRQAGTRRDRLTARLPMLRPPHAEGLVGAVWAEVRGTVDGRVEHRAVSASAPQATGAAAMAAALCPAVYAASDGGVKTVVTAADPTSLLKKIVTDVSLWTYDGAESVITEPADVPMQAARKWRLSGENGLIPTIS